MTELPLAHAFAPAPPAPPNASPDLEVPRFKDALSIRPLSLRNLSRRDDSSDSCGFNAVQCDVDRQSARLRRALRQVFVGRESRPKSGRPICSNSKKTSASSFAKKRTDCGRVPLRSRGDEGRRSASETMAAKMAFRHESRMRPRLHVVFKKWLT